MPAGPGINDNGSGSSSVLELAIQFFNSPLKPLNPVMFAWWAAEEVGLVSVERGRERKFISVDIGKKFGFLIVR